MIRQAAAYHYQTQAPDAYPGSPIASQMNPVRKSRTRRGSFPEHFVPIHRCMAGPPMQLQQCISPSARVLPNAIVHLCPSVPHPWQKQRPTPGILPLRAPRCMAGPPMQLHPCSSPLPIPLPSGTLIGVHLCPIRGKNNLAWASCPCASQRGMGRLAHALSDLRSSAFLRGSFLKTPANSLASSLPASIAPSPNPVS
jgi:hypothetical protein